jgi:hypothetical protein
MCGHLSRDQLLHIVLGEAKLGNNEGRRLVQLHDAMEENAASSAVTGLPESNLASRRKRKVKFSPSELTSNLCARSPATVVPVLGSGGTNLR